MKKYLLFSILVGLCIAPLLVSAQASLVKDIFPGSSSSSGSGPSFLTNVNGILFFTSNDGSHGQELWKSDGTTEGTVLVKDIFPEGNSDPYELTNVNSTLFFRVNNDPHHGRELWKSDGTEEGTVLVKDIRPGSSSSLPQILTHVNGTLFFSASDGIHGHELWKSDGTAEGTVLVKDIFPGSNSSDPQGRRFANVNGTLFFSASDGIHGHELWKSDGTAEGTILVKDINSGGNSSPRFLTHVNGTLFFIANDGIHGTELWKSDGTVEGTILVKDITSGGNSSPIPRYLTNVNGTLFFNANDGIHGLELWKSDGTTEGTVLVKDIFPGSGDSDQLVLTNVNGTLFFNANDGIHGSELWKSDGTVEGTVLVKDIIPGSNSGGFAPLTNMNGTLFFNANDGTHGRELWKSDGTEAGTILVADIIPGPGGSNPGPSVNIGTTLFFWANDGVHGVELWKYEETIQEMAVQSFTLVNADTDTDILELTEGMELNLNELPNAKFNIRANTVPLTVGSVRLQMSGRIKASRTENAAPYALFGDNNGNYNGQNLGAGEYTIKATPYSMTNRKGEQGMSLTLHFSIKGETMEEDAIQSFTLVNADTDKDIMELTEGMELNLNELLPARLNIRANTDPPTVGSVWLQLSGAVNASRKENVAPYALFGDNNGNYNGQNLGVGEYTITAIPYSNADLKGEQGISLSLNFSIVDTQAINTRVASEGDAKTNDNVERERLLSLPQKSWVYPNPFTHTFTVELSDFNGENVEVHLFDLYGKPLMMKNISTTSGAIEVDVESANMGAGTYLLKLIWGDRVEVIKLIREN